MVSCVASCSLIGGYRRQSTVIVYNEDVTTKSLYSSIRLHGVTKRNVII